MKSNQKFPAMLEAVTLETGRTRLEPLSTRHAPDLLFAGQDASVWQYLPHQAFADLEDARAWIAEACYSMSTGDRVAFAIIDRSSGRAVGSTSYLDLQHEHRGLEIGWTWLGLSHQRTHVNTECKYLLLKHAFDTLGAIRVQFQTADDNLASRRAMERIGAVFEGVLRNHRVRGRHIRHSAFYSITDDEWNSRIRELLIGLMERSVVDAGKNARKHERTVRDDRTE